MAKTNAILKRLVNKLFPIENAYHGTSQTDKARGTKVYASLFINCLFTFLSIVF